MITCSLLILTLSTIPFAIEPTSAVTVEKLLLDLSIESGRTIVAKGPIKNDWVLLNRRGAATAVALQAVADCLSASVRPQADGSLCIVRTSDDLKQLQKASRELRSHWLTSTLEENERIRREALAGGISQGLEILRQREEEANRKPVDKFPPAMNRFYAVQLLPVASLLENLVRRIGITRIAEIEPQTASVFQDQANALTIALPEHTDLLETYVDSVKKLKGGLGQSTGSPIIDSANSTFEKSDARELSLWLQVVSNNYGYEFRLDVFDRLGARIDGGNLRVTPETVGSTGRAKLDRLIAKTDETIQLSEKASQTIQLGNPRSLSELPEWFKNPDKFEPLNLFVSEALWHLSEQEETCTAIHLTDGLWPKVKGSASSGLLSLRKLITSLFEAAPYERVAFADHVVWRPVEPATLEARQADRTVLARFAKKFTESGGRFDFREKALLFGNARTQPGQFAGDWNIYAATSGKPRVNFDSFAYTFLNMLGKITEQDWNRLGSGAPLSAQSLGITKEMQNYLLREVGTKIAETGTLSDILKHPSSHFTSTGCGGVLVKLSESRDYFTGFRIAGSPASPISWFQDVDFILSRMIGSPRVGARKVVTFTQTRAEFEQDKRKYELFKMSRANFFVNVILPSGARIEGGFVGDMTDPSAPFTYADLDEARRKAIWISAEKFGNEQASKLRELLNGKTMLNPIAGGIGQKVPPPR